MTPHCLTPDCTALAIEQEDFCADCIVFRFSVGASSGEVAATASNPTPGPGVVAADKFQSTLAPARVVDDGCWPDLADPSVPAAVEFPDSLDIPPMLKRGHAECFVEQNTTASRSRALNAMSANAVQVSSLSSLAMSGAEQGAIVSAHNTIVRSA